MSAPMIHTANPKLDLEFERIVEVRPELLWMAWTNPKHLLKWFTPAPWTTVDCEIDLRPGGAFKTTMRSPEGQEFPHEGCYLEIVENRKLAWTNALAPGYRPAHGNSVTPCESFLFTAIVTIEAHGSGTRYRALLLHADEDGCRKHAEMGFHDGWSTALDQLLASVQGM